jgi:hypothetical protein
LNLGTYLKHPILVEEQEEEEEEEQQQRKYNRRISHENAGL